MKEDNNDDSFFYAQPRFVHHLDETFRSLLTNLYAEQISQDSVVLDLMSSWVSHLPQGIKYKRVIGHGLNRIELEKNNRLDSFWLQDLNRDQKLPLDDSSIDVCLMVAAWQYLQYPEEVAVEIRRILSPQGKLIVSFSNRAFWTKAPLVWKEGSSSDHINYVSDVLISNSWTSVDVVIKESKSNGIFSILGMHNDPFFSVIGIK
ncbi:methyltransferase domain-containing protein [Prochlorococcus sp. MIT 1307]|uniref:methyltransferase domain-containing protein n=1 Tax=Prochlorococcus sp. MIT 1307 TaxID=3096219 RepID=UPI002A747684|nr:methyltransferase domain-containing protein [Prochlorococcus sp. MIT 1307]